MAYDFHMLDDFLSNRSNCPVATIAIIGSNIFSISTLGRWKCKCMYICFLPSNQIAGCYMYMRACFRFCVLVSVLGV